MPCPSMLRPMGGLGRDREHLRLVVGLLVSVAQSQRDSRKPSSGNCVMPLGGLGWLPALVLTLWSRFSHLEHLASICQLSPRQGLQSTHRQGERGGQNTAPPLNRASAQPSRMELGQGPGAPGVNSSASRLGKSRVSQIGTWWQEL